MRFLVTITMIWLWGFIILAHVQRIEKHMGLPECSVFRGDC